MCIRDSLCIAKYVAGCGVKCNLRNDCRLENVSMEKAMVKSGDV